MRRFSLFMNDVRENSRLVRKQLFSDADLLVWNVIHLLRYCVLLLLNKRTDQSVLPWTT